MQSKESKPYRKNYINLLKMDDKRRRDRNIMLLSKLENIEKKAAFLQAKTDRIKSLKSIYRNHFNKIPNTITTYNRNNFYDGYAPVNSVPVFKNNFHNEYENHQYRYQNLEDNMIPNQQQTQCIIKNITLEEAIEEISKRFVLIPKNQTKYPKPNDNIPKDEHINLPIKTNKETLGNISTLSSFNETMNLNKYKTAPSVNSELNRSEEESRISDTDLDQQFNETNQLSSEHEKCDEEKRINDTELDFEPVPIKTTITIEEKVKKEAVNDNLKSFNNVNRGSPQKVELKLREYNNKQNFIELKTKIEENKDESKPSRIESKIDLVDNENVDRIEKNISKKFNESDSEETKETIHTRNNDEYEEPTYEDNAQYEEQDYKENIQYDGNEDQKEDYPYEQNEQHYDVDQNYPLNNNNDQEIIDHYNSPENTDQIYEENVATFDLPPREENINNIRDNNEDMHYETTEQEIVEDAYEQSNDQLQEPTNEMYNPNVAKEHHDDSINVQQVYQPNNEAQHEFSEPINEAYEQSDNYKEETNNLEYSESNVTEYNPDPSQINQNYDSQNTNELQYSDKNYPQNDEAYDPNVNYENQNYDYNNYQPYAEDQNQYNTEYNQNDENVAYQQYDDPNNQQYNNPNDQQYINPDDQQYADSNNQQYIDPSNQQYVDPNNQQYVDPNNQQYAETYENNNTSAPIEENAENYTYETQNPQQYQDYQGEQNQYDPNATYDTQYNENIEYSENSAELNVNQNIEFSEDYNLSDGQVYQNQTNDDAAIRPLQILESDVEPSSNKDETTAQESDFDFSVKQ